MFQDPTLYPWRTVQGNVRLGLESRGVAKPERAAKVEAALRLVGLDGFAEVFPHQLSGGMAQRAALARALVNAPRLLLLDEPLGKLDALTRLALQAEILRLWQETRFTALLVTHDVEEALVLAERVIVLSDRPAAIRADLPSICPIRATATIPNWCACAARSSASSVSRSDRRTLRGRVPLREALSETRATTRRAGPGPGPGETPAASPDPDDLQLGRSAPPHRHGRWCRDAQSHRRRGDLQQIGVTAFGLFLMPVLDVLLRCFSANRPPKKYDASEPVSGRDSIRQAA